MSLIKFPGAPDPEPKPKPVSIPDPFAAFEAVLRSFIATRNDTQTVGEALEELSRMPLKQVLQLLISEPPAPKEKP